MNRWSVDQMHGIRKQHRHSKAVLVNPVMTCRSGLSPFSAPGRPSECGSRHVRGRHRQGRKLPPADDLQEAPPAPATRSNTFWKPPTKRCSLACSGECACNRSAPCVRTGHPRALWAAWPESSCSTSAEECAGWRWCQTAWTSPGSHWPLKAETVTQTQRAICVLGSKQVSRCWENEKLVCLHASTSSDRMSCSRAAYESGSKKCLNPFGSFCGRPKYRERRIMIMWCIRWRGENLAPHFILLWYFQWKRLVLSLIHGAHAQSEMTNIVSRRSNCRDANHERM